MALHNVACPILLKSVSNKLPLHWQLFPDLLASLYLSNSETYILNKQHCSKIDNKVSNSTNSALNNLWKTQIVSLHNIILLQKASKILFLRHLLL